MGEYCILSARVCVCVPCIFNEGTGAGYQLHKCHRGQSTESIERAEENLFLEINFQLELMKLW